MNVFATFHDRVAAVLSRMVADGRLPADLDLGRFVVEPPRDVAHGDLAINAAMVYAREAKQGFGSPRHLASEIAAALAQGEGVESASVAGPGFINVKLKPAVYAAMLKSQLVQGDDFGRLAAQSARSPVNVEYVSTNPTGPIHVGHGRGAVFGDALANLLAFAGRAVTREYYINDAGAQVDVLARSAFLRYREALGESVGAVPEGLYPGDYLVPVGTALAERYGSSLRTLGEDQLLPQIRPIVIDAMMAMIRDDLAALNVVHEVFFSERSLVQGESDAVAASIAVLKAKDLVYEGRLPPPKGQVAEDWEDREQTLFRSSQFGDDVDRALLKSDGTYTYFASDIAYHKTKIDRGFRDLIDVWGADHGGYVKRMQAAVGALSDGTAVLDVKLCQLVKLMRAGEPVKMSKRSGDFITLREVVEEVGVDAVRFMMLFRKNDAPLDFDLAKVKEQSKDNPVFYVQYAHARTKSAQRQALTAFPELDIRASALAEATLTQLDDEGEQRLLKQMAQFPRVIEAAALAHEPHRLAFYLHDLASAFHAHWTRGKDQPRLRFVNEESRELTYARLAMVSAIGSLIRVGLGILGVSAPMEMR